MTKICHICKVDKPLESFNKNSSRKDKLQSRCRDCDRLKATLGYHTKYKSSHIKRSLKRKADIKKQYLDYKKTLRCKLCGDSRWYVLDFHHPKGSKEHNVSTLVTRGFSIESILQEANKCIALCSNCHKELHYNETTPNHL